MIAVGMKLQLMLPPSSRAGTRNVKTLKHPSPANAHRHSKPPTLPETQWGLAELFSKHTTPSNRQGSEHYIPLKVPHPAEFDPHAQILRWQLPKTRAGEKHKAEMTSLSLSSW